MGVVESIKELLTNKSSVQVVADDPQMAAEMLLLIRMMFADGEMTAEEISMFKSMCKGLFDIPEDDVPEVIRFLKDYGYETSGEQAASTFAGMSVDRKKKLLGHLATMARADNLLHKNEFDLIVRVAEVLGYEPEQIEEWLT